MSRREDAVDVQQRYYTETAKTYASMHAHEGSDDPQTRELIISVLRPLGIHSMLDVGSANGRGLPEFAAAFPGSLICGAEPVSALLQQGVASGVTAAVSLLRASGNALPFADDSFDVVTEFAMLHHVSDPGAVVKEMLRVARKAVVIVDGNRFGQGSPAARLFKLFLYKVGLWKAFDYLRTRGKYYQISEGDGLFYSYSVFDSFHLVAEWADRLVVYTGSPSPRSWVHPLLTSPGITLIGIRDERAK